MGVLKAVGVAVGIFVVWLIGATVLMAQQHIGQVYSPSLGAWITDPSPLSQDLAARWLGRAMETGFIVALISALVFYFRKGLARFANPPK